MRKTFIEAISHRIVDFTIVLTLLNVMYGVFLGVFAQYIITFDIGQERPTIHLLVSTHNLFFVALFFIYFIFDWFSANITLLFEGGVNHLILLFAVLFIFWLGFMVIFSLDPNFHLFLSFGIYSAIASSMDIELKYTFSEKNNLQDIWEKYSFFVVRLFISFCLLFFATLLIYDTNSESKSIMLILCYALLIALIVAKIFRYFWLVRLKHNFDCSKKLQNG